MDDTGGELGPDGLTWLQGWYAAQCDGLWEHSYGVAIDTVDNPGWSIRIDLAGTSLQGKAYERRENHRSEHDWVVSWIADGRFHAACGPLNLNEALQLFRQWAQR
jgi:hypothetical protein